MSDSNHWLEKLQYLTEELTDIRMVLDELLHVLRNIDRNGLGIYDADARWRVDGTGSPEVNVSRREELSTGLGPPAEEPPESEAPVPSARRPPQSRLFD
jgi:hypothetical protein